jgi:predicted CoA-binding protein
MNEALRILREAESVVLVDWPSPEVPESLVRGGFTVFVKGGPGPRDYAARELSDGDVVSRPLGERPARADLVYAYRPVEELPNIVVIGKELDARALWWQSDTASPEDSRRARELAQGAGLAYVDDVYIVDAVRELGRQ